MYVLERNIMLDLDGKDPITWKSRANREFLRYGFAAAFQSDSVYVFGGYIFFDGKFPTTDSIER